MHVQAHKKWGCNVAMWAWCDGKGTDESTEQNQSVCFTVMHENAQPTDEQYLHNTNG